MRFYKISLITLFFALDQITKFLIHRFFEFQESIRIIGNFVRLTYSRNPGGAFGLSFGSPFFLTITTTIIVILLFFLYATKKLRPQRRWGEFSLLLVMGGAVGNLFDRYLRGEVIDFIDVGLGNLRWPIFNVADIWVTLGIIGLFTYYTFFADEQKQEFL